LTATDIYNQCIDKQRIIIVGGGCDLIASIVVHVLRFHHRKFDFVLNGQAPSIQSESPLIIIEGATQLTDYKHHIIVFGISASSVVLPLFEALADATPKGGTLIYPQFHADLSRIGSKERSDVQSIGYRTYRHEFVEGKTVLITSTNERMPVNLSGDKDLQAISSAKELLKKIGISSSQFYKAIGEYRPS
jgi:UDP-N-acetylmuramate: L-alanyl-gamma-D-glutamyl-meso-diaminopimelate ligase